MPLTDNLSAYWDLDEVSGSAIDSHTNGLDLTDNNTVGTSAAGGPGGGRCRDFVKANSEHFSRASDAALQTGNFDFMFQAWVSFATVNSDAISYKYSGSTNEFAILGINVNDIRWYVGGYLAKWTGGVSLSTWYCIHAWHDSTGTTAYIDFDASGSPGSDATGSAPTGGDSEFMLGRNGDGGSTYLGALMQYAAFWKNGYPDGTDRTSLYNSGSGLSYSDLAGGVSVALLRRRGRCMKPSEYAEWREQYLRECAEKAAAARRDRVSFKARKRWKQDPKSKLYLPPDDGILTPRHFIGRAA